jgi:hypothetical protein
MWLAPILGGVLLEQIGGRNAVLVFGALTALAALIPTLTRTIRSVPRPAVWQAELDAASVDEEGAPAPVTRPRKLATAVTGRRDGR